MPTFQRPDDLRRLLDALHTRVAEAAAGDAVEILIVDNCPQGSARRVVQAAAPARYLHEPTPGVARARNAGVAAARGDFVLFIDDDEIPHPGWLAAYLAQATAGTAACFGPVMADFEHPPPEELRPALSRLFSRDLAVPTGTDITDRRAWLGTGNAMFRVKACFEDTAPFDTAFDAGGEDVWFLRNLVERKSVALTWCAEAVVDESVPAMRMQRTYIRQRLFRNGQLRCLVENGSARASASGRVALWMAIGAAQAGLYGTAALLLRPLDRVRATDYALRVHSGLGKLLWWR